MQNDFFCEYIGDSSDLAEKCCFSAELENDTYERLYSLLLPKIRKNSITPVGPIFREAKQYSVSLPPITLFDGKCVTFKGESKTDCLSLIGLTTAKNGHPAGEYAASVALITVKYNDGKTEKFPLRNRLEVCTSLVEKSEELNSCRAKNANRFAVFYYEGSMECYVINRLDIPLSRKEKVTEVVIKSEDPEYPLLVYGLFI